MVLNNWLTGWLEGLRVDISELDIMANLEGFGDAAVIRLRRSARPSGADANRRAG